MSRTDRLILITGPARSGKSEWAEQLAAESSQLVFYIATATVDQTDLEWQMRIEQHRQRRPSTWQTWEVADDLAAAISRAPISSCLLIDSLGTWLANHLEQDQSTWQQTQADLLQQLQQCQCQVILVAEETGWGVVPAYPLGRTFRDRLGHLCRCIGSIADAVYLVTGGYALNLKALGVPLAGRDRL
jgi:adenosylcobinamide kinase / adenosylcobinamide-phosphate guanylyltransferase